MHDKIGTLWLLVVTFNCEMGRISELRMRVRQPWQLRLDLVAYVTICVLFLT